MSRVPRIPKPSELKALKEAIASAGSQTKLAYYCGIDMTAVLAWRHTGMVPAERILKIERCTGVARHKLRPDIYPPTDYKILCLIRKLNNGDKKKAVEYINSLV